MIEVEVRNFQSIERASIKIDGFTAIAGRSNLGKSAILRALKVALTGAPVSAYVRHGVSCQRRLKSAKSCKCFCSVHIKTDGLDLLFEKGDSVNTYTINNTVYNKPERGELAELAPYLPVQVGDDKVLLQIADQFRPIFLLNQPGTVVADVLGDVANLDRVNVAIGLAEKDRKEAVSLRRVRETDVLVLQGALLQYTGLDAVLGRIGGVEDSLRALEATQTRVEQAEAFLTSAVTLSQRIRVLTSALDVQVPSPTVLLEAGAGVETLSAFSSALDARLAAVSDLDGVETLPVLAASAVVAASETVLLWAKWLDHLLALKSWMGEWKAAEEAKIPDQLALQATAERQLMLGSLLARYTVLDTNVTALSAGASVAALPALPSNVQVAALTRFVTQHEALTTALATLEADLAVVLTEAEQVQQEVKALGVCPTCTQQLGEGALCLESH